MAQTVNLWGATYSNVPALNVPSGNGTARFTDVTDTTATTAGVEAGLYFYDSNGVRREGSLVTITCYVGTATPSSGTGSNGDVYLKVVS